VTVDEVAGLTLGEIAEQIGRPLSRWHSQCFVVDQVVLGRFECSLTETQLLLLEHRLLGIIDVAEDRLRLYRLLEPRERYVRIHGKQEDIDFKASLIV